MDNEIVTVSSILSVDLSCYLLPPNNNNYYNTGTDRTVVNININKLNTRDSNISIQRFDMVITRKHFGEKYLV